MKRYVQDNWPRLAAVAIIAVLLVAGAFPDPAMAGALGALPFMIGDTSIADLKELLEKQGRAWEEYKKTNDELIKAKADGKAVGDIETKLATINGKLDEFATARTAIEGVLTKLNRPGGAGTEAVELEAEVKSFNVSRRATAPAGTQVADLDAEQYTAYKGAYWTFVRKGTLGALSDAERKALQAGVDTDGGYLMPTPTVGRVVKKVFELSPVRQIANVMTISGEAIEGLIDNDEAATGGWVGETASRSETNTPTVGKWRIDTFEQYAAPRITQKLLDDAAVDIEAWLAMKIADKFARYEAAAFITGDGVAKPHGFTTYTLAATGDATRAWGQLEKVKSGANGDFAASNPADKLFDLIQAFKTAYLRNANWVTTREVIAKIRKFKEATTNAYMWQPGLAKGTPDSLLGYPIVMAQDMPALATGSASLALGDFNEGYQIVDRIGIRTLRDPYTAKPYVIFYSTKRVGGAVLNSEAIKFITFES